MYDWVGYGRLAEESSVVAPLPNESLDHLVLLRLRDSHVRRTGTIIIVILIIQRIMNVKVRSNMVRCGRIR